jgi:hypothetical protein
MIGKAAGRCTQYLTRLTLDGCWKSDWDLRWQTPHARTLEVLEKSPFPVPDHAYRLNGKFNPYRMDFFTWVQNRSALPLRRKG